MTSKPASPIERSLRLVSLLSSHPSEFYDRIAGIAEFRSEALMGRLLTKESFPYEAASLEKALCSLSQGLGSPIQPFLAEQGLRQIEDHVRRQTEELQAKGPFGLFHNADFILAKLTYVLCRALRPAVVLETGVAYGVSSAFVLKALEVNGEGALYSIDLPPLGKDADEFVGYLIPEELRSRWHLYRGMSRRVMPALLPQVGPVGLFLHDAMHTYRNMTWELSTVVPYLASPAAVIADDIDYHAAFRDWAHAYRPQVTAMLSEDEKGDASQRRKLLGVAAFAAKP